MRFSSEPRHRPRAWRWRNGNRLRDDSGIKGAFSASVLAALERDTGKAAADYFDLIVGTSTGGISALGLGLGKTAQDIVEFYRAHGPHLFPSTSLVERTTGGLRQGFGTKHSHDVTLWPVAPMLWRVSRPSWVAPQRVANFGGSG